MDDLTKMLFTPSGSEVVSVTTLNRMARDLLEAGLPPVWIGGEISNLTVAASGHAYFSLKDAGAQIRCVMFRQRLAHLPFRPQNGMQVELKGPATIYEARGDFQINVETMRTAGLGRLYEAFERLKAQLAAEGLFAPERKRPVPAMPRAVGIVTSPAAAALRDVVTTLGRRMPGLPLILYPTPVQGDGAAQQIARAIRTAAERAEVDLLIVCRGGGSIEDLWAFNEEAVARAVAASPIPVISGVGHETDFTICDFAADLRAPTPTAAAELAAPSREQLAARVEHLAAALRRAMQRQLDSKAQQLDHRAHRLRHPGERLAQQRQQLAHAADRLTQRATARLAAARWRLQLSADRLARACPATAAHRERLARARQDLALAASRLLERRQARLDQLAAMLTSFNPQAVLARGYAIVQNKHGVAVKSAETLNQGERVTLKLAVGSTEALIDHPAGVQPKLPF